MIRYHNRPRSFPGAQIFGWGFTLLFLVVLMPFVSLAQTTNETTLPPEAQAAMKKGIIAAKQQDYLLAVRYFQDARKIAPNAPEIFFNLGLAESKIPGRELRAICWFGVYLAVTTNAPNAAAVQDQIDALDVKNQSNISHLIQSAQDAAIKIKVIKYSFMTNNYDQNQAISKVVELWAQAGDYTAALKEAKLLTPDSDTALGFIARAEAEAGDITGSKKTADLIKTAAYKSGILKDIADAQVKAASTNVEYGDPAVMLPDGWLVQDSDSASMQLNSEPFLDLAGYLKSLPSSDDPNGVFGNLYSTASTLLYARNNIDRMLKEKAKLRAKP